MMFRDATPSEASTAVYGEYIAHPLPVDGDEMEEMEFDHRQQQQHLPPHFSATPRTYRVQRAEEQQLNQSSNSNLAPRVVFPTTSGLSSSAASLRGAGGISPAAGMTVTPPPQCANGRLSRDERVALKSIQGIDALLFNNSGQSAAHPAAAPVASPYSSSRYAKDMSHVTDSIIANRADAQHYAPFSPDTSSSSGFFVSSPSANSRQRHTNNNQPRRHQQPSQSTASFYHPATTKQRTYSGSTSTRYGQLFSSGGDGEDGIQGITSPAGGAGASQHQYHGSTYVDTLQSHPHYSPTQRRGITFDDPSIAASNARQQRQTPTRNNNNNGSRRDDNDGGLIYDPLVDGVTSRLTNPKHFTGTQRAKFASPYRKCKPSSSSHSHAANYQQAAESNNHNTTGGGGVLRSVDPVSPSDLLAQRYNQRIAAKDLVEEQKRQLVNDSRRRISANVRENNDGYHMVSQAAVREMSAVSTAAADRQHFKLQFAEEEAEHPYQQHPLLSQDSSGRAFIAQEEVEAEGHRHRPQEGVFVDF